jgi:23S rRNA (pseudouridine1915-N3)-methyltransferase
VKIYVYYIGKARDEHSNGIAAEFLKRTSRYLKCEMREIHPDRFDLFTRHASANKVLLDPAGKKFDSAQFTAMVEKAENEARDLIFVLGGARIFCCRFHR